MGKGHEKFGVVPLDAFCIESSRLSKLIVHISVLGVSLATDMQGRAKDVHNKASSLSDPFFKHQIHGQLSSELDQSVIPGLGDNQDGLYIGPNAGTACS